MRLRRSGDYGGAAASITVAKQQRVILAARHYLQRHSRADRAACRFDAVLFDGHGPAQPQWVKNAFLAE